MQDFGRQGHIIVSDSFDSGVIVQGRIHPGDMESCLGRAYGLILFQVDVGTIRVFDTGDGESTGCGRLFTLRTRLYIETFGKLIERITSEHTVRGHLVIGCELPHKNVTAENGGYLMLGVGLTENQRQSLPGFNPVRTGDRESQYSLIQMTVHSGSVERRIILIDDQVDIPGL